MKNLKKWYINLSIQRKILYCTLGVALVVLLAASVSQYMSASSIVTEQTRKQSAGVVNELSVNLDHYFDMVRNSFEYIANNSTVQEELESDEPYKSNGTLIYIPLALLMLAVSLPLVIHFGAEKGRYIAMVMWAIIFAVVYILIKTMGLSADAVDAWLNGLNWGMVLAGVVLFTVIVYMGSFWIGVRLMEKKEF